VADAFPEDGTGRGTSMDEPEEPIEDEQEATGPDGQSQSDPTGDPAASSSQGASGAGRTRHVGKDRTPWLVPILTFLTLGIYGLYWAWTVTKEAEGFDDARQRPHGPAKWGAITSIVLFLIVIGGGVAFLGIAESAEEGADPGAALAAQGLSLALIGLVGIFWIIVGILFLIAFWRLWNWIEFHETQLDHDPLSPGLLIGIWIAAVLLGWIPMIGWLLAIGGTFYVYYRTQQGLNTVWDAGGRGYTPPAPR
jgi:uncharacterized membrane protein